MSKAQEKLLQEYTDANRLYASQNAQLSDRANQLAVQLNFANGLVNQCRKDVDQFKAEAAQAAVTIAEMKGYIARTLEDDRVREQPKIEAAPDSTTTVRHERQYSDPLRYGPLCYQGVPSCAGSATTGMVSFTDRCEQTAAPKPWHSR